MVSDELSVLWNILNLLSNHFLLSSFTNLFHLVHQGVLNKTQKSNFQILAHQACILMLLQKFVFQHFVEFFALCQLPFLTLSLRPYGFIQPQPQPAPRSLCAKALSYLSTEDQRGLQCLQPHCCSTCQTSFSAPLPLLSAHVFPRLTTNPVFMCIIRSLGLSGVTALETLSHVVASLASLSLPVCSTSGLFVCLFVFVCVFVSS